MVFMLGFDYFKRMKGGNHVIKRNTYSAFQQPFSCDGRISVHGLASIRNLAGSKTANWNKH